MVRRDASQLVIFYASLLGRLYERRILENQEEGIFRGKKAGSFLILPLLFEYCIPLNLGFVIF